MHINIDTSNDAFLDKIYSRAMKELNDFYGINWTHHTPTLAIVKDRKTIDAIRGNKTEDWLVGWINMSTRIVYILDRYTLEKESCHKYTPESYYRLVKHELSHCFSSIISDRNTRPDWLWEGLAVYTSGQNAEKKIPEKFTNFLGFYDKSGGGVYAESGFAVQILVEKFGKQKLFRLIKKLRDIKSRSDFDSQFKTIYGFKPNYTEFNKSIGLIK